MSRGREHGREKELGRGDVMWWQRGLCVQRAIRQGDREGRGVKRKQAGRGRERSVKLRKINMNMERKKGSGWEGGKIQEENRGGGQEGARQW